MNINRDYLIINDVKKSNIKLDNGSMFFYITDKNTQNIFVNLVINVSNNDLIQKYANIENAEDYTLTMNIVKPSNTYKVVEGKLHDKEKAIFEFNLSEDCCDKIGTYRCELLTKCNINGHEEITTSNKLTYKVKSSILNDLDDIVEAPEYPLVIQLFDKLSDINQYEENRRANELTRQLAEEQRQTRFNALDADMTNSIQAIDDKVVDVENRIVEKEQAIDKLIVDTKVDIDDYKVAKDTEIDEYKVAKDTEINEAITNQNTAINTQNDRIAAVEDNVVAQNSKLDTLETKATTHEARITAVEAKDTEQDSRLDVAENRLANIGNDITNTMQPIIDEHTSRLDAIEAIDVAQNNRLGAIEAKNTEQDDRLLDIEKVNNRQDIDIKCLYGASQTIDVTKEGNNIYLQNSNNGFAVIDEIQGNTLVNCNKEPNKELILNGNINTSGDNTVTLAEGVDGGLVDVALEGNTLVNVSKTKDSTALPLSEELTYLYANTQYTVQFNSDTAITADITLGGTPLLAQSIVAGLNRIGITTPETLVDNKLIIDGVGANISEVVVTDTDREFMYFEGMKSVGECEDLAVVVKNTSNPNLFNVQEFINLPVKNGLYHNSYKYSANDDNTINIIGEDGRAYGNMPYMQLEPNTTYTFSAKGSGIVEIETSLSKKSKNYNTFTTDDTGQVKVKFFSTAKENITVKLEVGNVSTIGIISQSNSQQLTHEPLRAVGDIKDKYVLIDGKWYIERNCAEVVLDGVNNPCVGRNAVDTDTTIKLFFSGQDIHARKAGHIISSNLPKGGSDAEHIALDGTSPYGNIRVALNKTKLDYSSLNSINSYLQSNNIRCVLELASPTYEPIDYNPFEVYSDITHISNNSTIPANMTIKNTGYNCLLKPNTTYTVSSNLGLNTVTTPSVLTEDCLRFYDTDTSDVTTMKNVLVLEGDWTSKADLIPANFSGIESAFEQEYDAEKGKYKVNVKVTNEDKSKENNVTFYINEPLRGVGNVKDRIYVKDDKVVVQRNCGSVTFDGSDDEKWIMGAKAVANLSINLGYDSTLKQEEVLNRLIANYKLGNEGNLYNGASYGLGYKPSSKIMRLRIFNIETIEQLKQWLQANPVKVVYQLAEPVYEEVEYNDTKLFIESFKNSTLFYNSNVPVTSKLYYSYSVPIVDTVAKTASISDEQDQLIINLATEVAVMEMMLM